MPGFGVAGSTYGVHSIQKIHGLRITTRDLEWLPTELCWVRRLGVEVIGEVFAIDGFPRPVSDSRQDAIKPTAFVVCARSSKSGTAQLFCVQTIRAHLRVVLAYRQ